MNLILLLLAAAGISLLQSWVYRRYWDVKLDAAVFFPPAPAVEGESTQLTEVITNQKFLPLPALHVKFQFHRNLQFQNQENTAVTDQCYRSDIFSVLPFQRITRTLTVSCPHRGYYTIRQLDLIAHNLLMTDALVWVFPVNTWLYVYPRPIDDALLEVPFQKIMGTVINRRYVYPDPFSFRGIREYQTSDPMNTVNWKATAHTGELMVNTHDSTVSQQVVLLLNLEEGGLFQANQLHEESIRLAAALSLRLLNASVPVRVVCNGLDTVTRQVIHVPAGNGARQAEEINECLARIDLELDTPVYAPFLEEELYSHERKEHLYILIGASQHTSTVALAESLAQKTGTLLWILPFYPDTPPGVSSTDQIELLQWEVTRHAS